MNTIELKDFKVDLPLRSKAGETKVVSPSTEVQIIVPSDVAHELTSVTVEGIKTESKTVRSGAEEQIISPSDGKFIDEVIVQPITLQEKSVTPTTDEVVVLPDDEFVGLTKVTVEAVNPVDYQKPEESKAVTPTTEKQVITPSNGAVFSSVTVEAVDPSDYYKIEETTTIVPSESEQVVTPSEGNVFGSVTVSAIQTEEKTVTANGEVTPSSGKYLSKVTVAVPDNSADAKPEVGIIITPKKEQQVVTPTGNNVFNSVTVEKIPDEYIIPTGTKSITENGTHIVTEYANVEVNVEGLVPSGTKTITENGTYDITEFASAEVNVPSQTPTLVTKEITENGTYNASDDNADGYSSVTVNVAGSGGGDDSQLIGLVERTITNIDIPEGTTKIGYYGVAYCKELASITIPTTLTYIDYRAFYNCSKLTRVNIKDLNKFLTIGLYDSDSAPTKVSNAGLYLNGNLVTELTLPSNATKYILYGCSSIETINFESGITEIPEAAAYKMTGLKTANIPDSVTKLNNDVFNGCTSLPSITIPENVTSIGYRAFQYCDNMTEFNFNAINCAGIDSVGNYYATQYMGRNGDGVTVNVGNKVKQIPNYLFYGSSSSNRPKIVAVKFAPDGVCTSIGSGFNYMTTIKTVVLAPSFKSIPSSFNASSVEKYDCTSYTFVPTLSATTNIKLSDTGKVYVPDSLYDEWISATNWVDIADKIVKASEMPTE